MIVDASALVSILTGEADAEKLAARLDAAETPMTHQVSVYEAVTALMRQRRQDAARVEEAVVAFLLEADIAVLDIGKAETAAALEAFGRYGKGRHPAQLNMGDCFSYGCAKIRGVPLLYKGRDFSQTDLA